MSAPSATPWFGVHAGLQRTSTSELAAVWRRAEDLGFDWVSIWDHFYAADGTGDPESLEAVACHAALAVSTSRVRCGSLVYSAGFRHPAVLANAIATIDQPQRWTGDPRARRRLAGRRVPTPTAFPFGTPGDRLRLLREYIQVVRLAAAGGAHDLRGRALHAHRRRLRAEAGAGASCRSGSVAAARRSPCASSPSTPTAGTSPSCRPRPGPTSPGCSTATASEVGRDPAEVTRTVNVGHGPRRRRPAVAVRGHRRLRAPGGAGRHRAGAASTRSVASSRRGPRA